MYWTDEGLISQLEKITGNRFEAISQLCALVRSCTLNEYPKLSDSEALVYTVTGAFPYDYDKRKTRDEAYLDWVNRCIDEFLSSIKSVDVADCVRSSIDSSLTSGHLIYIYHSISDEYVRSRIRVLCQMIWTKIHQS